MGVVSPDQTEGRTRFPFGISVLTRVSDSLPSLSHLPDEYLMIAMIVLQGNFQRTELDPVKHDVRAQLCRRQEFDGDVIDRFAIAVMHDERVPFRGDARIHPQFVDFEL